MSMESNLEYIDSTLEAIESSLDGIKEELELLNGTMARLTDYITDTERRNNL